MASGTNFCLAAGKGKALAQIGVGHQFTVARR
jgi:hypothetical protein